MITIYYYCEAGLVHEDGEGDGSSISHKLLGDGGNENEGEAEMMCEGLAVEVQFEEVMS